MRTNTIKATLEVSVDTCGLRIEASNGFVWEDQEGVTEPPNGDCSDVDGCTTTSTCNNC